MQCGKILRSALSSASCRNYSSSISCFDALYLQNLGNCSISTFSSVDTRLNGGFKYCGSTKSRGSDSLGVGPRELASGIAFKAVTQSCVVGLAYIRE